MKILPLSKFECQSFPIIDRYETVEVAKTINGKTFTVKEQQPVYKQGVIDITQEQLDGIIARTHCFNEDLTAVILYVPTQGELQEKRLQEVSKLRQRRERECFAIINRGQLWYNTLSIEQKSELQIWYQAWLDVTNTLAIPKKPIWLN